jgi:hypothetical protein
MPNPNAERNRRPQDEEIDDDDMNRPSGGDRGESMERARDEGGTARQSDQDDDDMDRPDKDHGRADHTGERGTPAPSGQRGSGRAGSKPHTTRKK